MVNINQSEGRNRLLKLLRRADAPCSGEELGRQLGMSRVAVHKHIGVLRNHGYAISSTRRGYALDSPGIEPFTDWEFAGGEQITVVGEADSTMDVSSRLAEQHPGLDFTLAARKQTAGRDRHGRHWESPDGGLWVTRMIHPDGSAFGVQRHVMAAAAVLARLLRSEYDVPAQVKWPSDVIAPDGRKIAGVLGEAHITGDRIESLALGLGMNVNNPAAGGTAALNELTGRDEDRRDLLRKWVSALDAFLESADFRREGPPEWWMSLMAGIGESAAHSVRGTLREGRIVGVDALGRLELRNHSGRLMTIAPGDVDDDALSDTTQAVHGMNRKEKI